METDRPDQTESPFIVKRGYLQNESGFNFNNKGAVRDYFLPTNLLKYGLLKKLEMRYTFTLSLSEHLFNYRSESIGIKYMITEGKHFLPRTSLIAQYHLNKLKRDPTDLNRLPHSIGDVVFTFQNEITSKFSIGYNFGAEFHTNGMHEGIFRLAPGLNIGQRGYAYTEIFGRFPLKEYNDTWFDGGFAYYINEDFKVDISAGKSFSSGYEYYFALGISTRSKLLHNKLFNIRRKDSLQQAK